jgi:hypothetical protein
MNFDLNIDNYTKSELIEMFGLPQNYDKNIVEIKETKLRDSIINNKEVNIDTQNLTVKFLVKAKKILLNAAPQESNNNTTSELLSEKILEIYNTSYELKPCKLEDPSEHMVQNPANKPYLASFPGEYFPGVINNIKKRTTKRNISVDSKFRDNYYATTASNYLLSLPGQFNNILAMQLTAIELPTTYYNVSKQYSNNFFTITVDTSSNTSTSVVNIPSGNYNHDGIVNIINTELALLGGDFALVNFLININNNSGSGQMMVGPNDSSITSITLNFQADRFGNDDRSTPLPLKFGWMLGFRNGIYTNSINYVSEGLVDVTGPRYVYLVIDDFNNSFNNGFYGILNSSMLNNNILARISLQSNPFNIQIENNLNIVTTPREYFGPVNIANLAIQLQDEYGRVIDLNNMDFSFCLTLTSVYDI